MAVTVFNVALDYVRGVRREPGDWVKAFIILGLGLPLIAAAIAALGFFATFYMFRPEVAIPAPRPGALAETSTIYAADGSVIARFHAEHNRELVTIDQMPKHLQQAVVAIEDERFYEHRGVDFKAVVRAFSSNLGAGETTQGGSTITQQYVKQAYVGTKRTLLRKLREARIAVQLEREISKDRILERYLNTVYFGRGAYGVEAASMTYFDKPAAQVTLSEAALLAGLIQAPERLSPFQNPTEAERRRKEVLARMEVVGSLTSDASAKAEAEQPALVKPKLGEEVFRYPWFVDAVRRYMLQKYGEEAVFAGGLKVYTTIDPAMQAAAEEAIRKLLPDPEDPYASLASIDPATGYVRALVGGRNYEEEKFNIAIQGPRQPGSAFKPFVLVAALENGIAPTDRYSGPATICLKEWLPDCMVHNYDNDGYGSLTLAEATARSVNTVYAQLVLQVGPDKVVDVARRMGINGEVETSLGIRVPQIEPVPALALGSEEVTTLEMASAFATLAARGVYRQPKFVTRVTDRKGEVLEEGPSPDVRALSEPVADTATELLMGVITGGTGRRADIDRPAAGKTGTASDYRNAWFAGYTPELGTAVWVGYKEANKELRNIRGLRVVTGGTLPAQIWSTYMRQALKGTPEGGFAEAGRLLSGRFRLPLPPCPSPDPNAVPSPTDPGLTPDPALSPGTTPGTSPLPSPVPSYSPFPLPTQTPDSALAPFPLQPQQAAPGATLV
ncbi:MAG: PBP1A family penicillin-binding protein, partial [Actinomycetota bacterium]